MAIKDILLPLVSRPKPTTTVAIESRGDRKLFGSGYFSVRFRTRDSCACGTGHGRLALEWSAAVEENP
jgi:hypothetical protein